MRRIIRTFLLLTLALFLATQLYKGITVTGGGTSFFLAGLTLTIAHFIIRPIIKIISIPLTVLTLGIFSLFVNGITLFIVSYLYPSIIITAFTYPSFTLGSIITPSFHVPLFLSYTVISATIYAIYRIGQFLCED